MIGKMSRLATIRLVAGDKSSIEPIVLFYRGWYFICIVPPGALLSLNSLLIAPLPLYLLQTAAGLSRSRPADENVAKNPKQDFTNLCGYQTSIVCRVLPLLLSILFDRTP